MGNVTEVNFGGMTPEEAQSLLKQLQDLARLKADLERRAKPLLDARAAAIADEKRQKRMEAYEVRNVKVGTLNALLEENRRIGEEYTNLLHGGAENVPKNEKGERIEAKIKFSKEEETEFAQHFANLAAVESKQSKAAAKTR